MERQDLSATSWVTSRLVALILGLAGVLFLFEPAWLGWRALAESLGGEARVVGAGLGVAFLVLAALSFEKNRMRERLAEQTEGLHQLLYGRDYAREREAIEILLRGLDAADPAARAAAHQHLTRLTGQNFAPDPVVWRAWWSANARTWAARRGDAPADAGPGSSAGGGA